MQCWQKNDLQSGNFPLKRTSHYRLAVYVALILASSEGSAEQWTNQIKLSLGAESSQQQSKLKSSATLPATGESSVKTDDRSIKSGINGQHTFARGPVSSLTLSWLGERDQSTSGKERLQTWGADLVYVGKGPRATATYGGGGRFSKVNDSAAVPLGTLVQNDAPGSSRFVRSRTIYAQLDYNLTRNYLVTGKIESTATADEQVAANQTARQQQTNEANGASAAVVRSLSLSETLRLETSYKRDSLKTGVEATSIYGVWSRGLHHRLREWQASLTLGVDHIVPRESRANGAQNNVTNEETSQGQGKVDLTGTYPAQTVNLEAKRGLERRPITNSLILADTLAASYLHLFANRSREVLLSMSQVKQEDLLLAVAGPAQTVDTFLIQYGMAVFSKQTAIPNGFVDRATLGYRYEQLANETQNTSRSTGMLGYFIQF